METNTIETKKNIFDRIGTSISNAIDWFSGFFQDQSDRTSSKRLVLYTFTYFFYLEVKGNIDHSTAIDGNILWATVAIIAFCIGAVTSEFFKSFTPKQI